MRTQSQRQCLEDSAQDREFDFRQADLAVISKLVFDYSGIVIGPSKMDMVYARLSRRLRDLGMTRFEDYCTLLTGPNAQSEFTRFQNAMTTNLTRFFREMHHFDFLRSTALPQIKARNAQSRRLRIWSAGCSSGEEAYSIAMTCLEMGRDFADWDIKILASDLDTHMVSKGAEGIYDHQTVADISKPLLSRYFKASKGQYEVNQALRDLIKFKPLNLLGPWPMQGQFDIIFCRNVMIYFDNPTKARLLERFSQQLIGNGHLFIGHSESLLEKVCDFKLVGRTIYQNAQSPNMGAH